MNVRRLCLLAASLLFLQIGAAIGAEYHVATTGSDSDPGTAEQPFATPAKGVSVAVAGDTIWMHGGTYSGTAQINMNQSGTVSLPIRVWAVDGEQPVLDFTGQANTIPGLYVGGAYWHLKGLKIQHAGKIGIKVYGGHHNLFESLTLYSNGFTGLNISNGAYENTVLNCDSYENNYPADHHENGDGFGVKTNVGTGNKLIGCRAWSNADDGFDFWQAGNAVTIQDCYAWRNGENIWGDTSFAGDGGGFKLGENGGAHFVIRCMAWDQPVRGFDLNNNSSGVTLYNCTAIRCNINYAFTASKGNIELNVLRNCLSYGGTNNIASQVDSVHNSWNTAGVSITTEDFHELDPGELEGPRDADWSLPKGHFARLTPTSEAIDAGWDVGLSYSGLAPDFGAFECYAGLGELNGDCIVNWHDAAVMASEWLTVGTLANLSDSGLVDFLDFALLMQHWMEF